MMKELCIVNCCCKGAIYGVGTYIEEYMYCLTNLGFNVTLVELGKSEENKEFYIKEEGCIRTFFFPYPIVGEANLYYKGVCRLLQLYIEDSENLIFHLQYSPCEALLYGVKHYFPLSKSIFTIHYLHWRTALLGNVELYKKIIRNKTNEIFKNKYNEIIVNFLNEKSFLEKIDRIVCLSDDTLDLIQNLYEIKHNVWQIQNGLRTNKRRLSMKKNKLRKKYLINPNEKLLLFVGRIEPIKGIESLIICFKKVLKKYQNCSLVVVGDGNLNDAIKLCKKYWNKIIFTGRLDKETLFQWYMMADIALFPSYNEECSYVGIEMMMHGLPIIASDGYSVKNMFYDGINSRVAKIESWKTNTMFIKNLKEAILQVLSSDILKSNLKKGAISMYQSKYGIEQMQSGYEKLINSL